MPLSSKKIIEVINSVSEPLFNQATIRSLLVEQSAKTKKGKTKTLTQKEQNRINDLFFLLTAIGYLETRGSRFELSKNFDNTGKIRITGSGKGSLKISDFTIQFRKEDIMNAHNGDTVAFALNEYRSDSFFGKVTSIKKRHKEIYYAKVSKKTSGMIYYHLIDLPGQFFAVSARHENEPKPEALVVVELTGKQLGGHPECTLLRVDLGDNEELDFERVVNKFNLPPSYGKTDSSLFAHMFKAERHGRTDFSSLVTVTIDGEHAKDFDDAVSFESTENGYRLYVHIADVSAYVHKGDELDRTALERGNSYYLGNRVIPMLPEVLSNKLCSLREGEERLTVTAIIEYNHELNILHTEFHRSVIVVTRRLTYTNAETLINDEEEQADDVSKLVTDLNRFAQKLRKIRIAAGRIDLDLTDFELLYDDENRFTTIGIAKRLRTHELVEECMLAANEAVARLLRKKDIPALYRVHEEISDENWFKLKNFLAIMGIPVKRNRKTAVLLQQIIDNYRSSDFSYLVNLVILKSMMQAFYGTSPMGHFGLGFKDYTHFTSPIRRYSDLIIHRIIKAHISGSDNAYTKEELVPIGEKCSEMERVAQKAERDLYKIKSCRLMENSIGEEFTAMISGMSKFGLYAVLKEKPVEGMIPFMLMNDDYYVVNEETFTVRGRSKGRIITLGDSIKVTVVKADHLSGQIDLVPVDLKPGKKSSPKDDEKNSTRKKGKEHAFSIFKGKEDKKRGHRKGRKKKR
ncbi:MAG: VacB/RNase II family 3'-5' exoribonuclease [Spirochaetes bacterium]|jgi:ribonuclease R|nr:VacB/RNase II family 3'-5' exoribonuclease [Spirochaetota bacterium]